VPRPVPLCGGCHLEKRDLISAIATVPFHTRSALSKVVPFRSDNPLHPGLRNRHPGCGAISVANLRVKRIRSGEYAIAENHFFVPKIRFATCVPTS
jgi:hypothetical protein